MYNQNKIERLAEMVYGDERKTTVLAKGTYREYDVLVLSYGTHPCCYIKLEEGNKYYGKDYNDIPVDCHYGLTFGEKTKSDDANGAFGNAFWIGWDYAHLGDQTGGFFGGRKYTTDELIDDLKFAVDSLCEKIKPSLDLFDK